MNPKKQIQTLKRLWFRQNYKWKANQEITSNYGLILWLLHQMSKLRQHRLMTPFNSSIKKYQNTTSQSREFSYSKEQEHFLTTLKFNLIIISAITKRALKCLHKRKENQKPPRYTRKTAGKLCYDFSALGSTRPVQTETLVYIRLSSDRL